MRILAVLLCLLVAHAAAQVPLKSATWRGPDVPCGQGLAGADLMPLNGQYPGQWETQNAPPNAGVWPAGQNLTVRKICVTHGGSFSGPSYAVVGHSGPNGDHVSPYVSNGAGTQCLSFDKDAPVVVTGGEYFDVHAGCQSGSHHAVLTIWFTQP